MGASGVLADMQHALVVGGRTLPGDHDHSEGPSYVADPSHDEGEVCGACGMRVQWPGIEDPCRVRARSRVGVPLSEVPSIFALLWRDFEMWWQGRHADVQHVPTVDEWLHQLMEFRKQHRKAIEE